MPDIGGCKRSSPREKGQRCNEDQQHLNEGAGLCAAKPLGTFATRRAKQRYKGQLRLIADLILQDEQLVTSRSLMALSSNEAVRAIRFACCCGHCRRVA